VADDIENLRFNTAISALMVLFNDLSKLPGVTQETFQKFIQILHPFAPHLTEEIWQQKGYEGFVLNSTWPTADKSLLQDDTVDMGVQINGKVRERLLISRNATREEIEQRALASAKVQSYLNELEVKKVIVVPGRMVSIVATPKK
jgi:leucyl-tRNA synthetase